MNGLITHQSVAPCPLTGEDFAQFEFTTPADMAPPRNPMLIGKGDVALLAAPRNLPGDLARFVGKGPLPRASGMGLMLRAIGATPAGDSRPLGLAFAVEAPAAERVEFTPPAGARFPVGEAYITPAARAALGRIDPAAPHLELARGLLARHAAGDAGEHGKIADAVVAADDRRDGPFAPVPSRNAISVEAGKGPVRSQYSLPLNAYPSDAGDWIRVRIWTESDPDAARPGNRGPRTLISLAGEALGQQ